MMKKACIILFVLFFMHSYAQKKDPDAAKKTDAGKKEELKKEVKKASGLPEGYRSVKWGDSLSKARDGITGKLVFTDDKRVIVSKDGDIEYQYGFFYKDPALLKTKDELEKEEKAAAEKKDTAGTERKDEGILFFVSIKFPYLDMKSVITQMEKYGPPTNENLTDHQGAVAWNSDRTLIVLWVDRYEKKPYCRRITYIDKSMTAELEKYQTGVFKRAELDIIKKLNPSATGE